MKKVKKKKNILTHSSGPQTTFFCDNSKLKIVASIHCAYASKGKMRRIWLKFKKKNFSFNPQVPYLLTLHDIKIIKIREIKNLTLGHL
jgi:hypothetical protein